MELTTGILKVEQIKREIDTIVSLLGGRGVERVAVSYGFGCEIDTDKQYKDIYVPTDRVDGFIEETVTKGIYDWGEYDLYIKSYSPDVEFLLCHESDIHAITDNKEIFEWIKSKWLSSGYVVRQTDDEWQELM